MSKKKKLGRDEASILIRANEKLSKADPEIIKIPEAFRNLLVAGLIDKQGYITDAGKSIREKLIDREKDLLMGSPVENHTIETKQVYRNRPWYRVRLNKQDVTVGVYMIYFGKPRKGISVSKSPDGLTKQVRSICDRVTKECTVEVVPVTYRIPFLAGPELVDFKMPGNDDTIVSVQAQYFSFVADDKRKSFKFMAHDCESPLVVWRVSESKEDRLAAMIMPFIEMEEA